MARYVDADELLNKLPNDLPYKASVKRVLIQAPTADVVPKSEVEKLELTLQGVMWSVDKWLDETDYDADPIKRAITMREKTLQIVENAKTETAREIFEEIGKATGEWGCYFITSSKMGYLTSDVHRTLAELKKKYTEELK